MILDLLIYMVSQDKRLAAQERQRLNDTPHLLSRGGYAKLEKKLRKSRADALGLESPDLAPAPARYELWKAARTKSDGNMTSSSAALISQRIVSSNYKQLFDCVSITACLLSNLVFLCAG
ncbi:hypothetical protein VIGAN_09061100 [Vigna angularis var. angularis]|uniref:Uncharacterized protein n=1 Tax=Vigna angularis var. angularis TaxID=157739 RepID=A0A0S3SWU6_PHAAN|nr:hypothetical protein VIGAN_09061100 [Vigna angularis var. angularis]